LDFNDIAFGNGLFVAVGGRYNPTDGFVVTSSDGRAWNHQELGAKRLRVVQYGAGGFVIGGNDLAMFRSADGFNWTRTVLGGGEGVDGLNFRSLTYGNGAWVATGNDGVVAYSPDGKSWAITSSAHGYNLRGAISWRDRVILVGGRGRVLVSEPMFASLKLEIRDRVPTLRVVRGFSGRVAVEVSADILHWEHFIEASFEEEDERRYSLSPGLPAQFFRICP
jgi:hypothetical protein